MQINRNNYEIFFLDYRENNLSPQQVAELMVFLEENPDLKNEFQEFDEITLDADSSKVFKGKNSLKKKQVVAFGQIDSHNYEQKMIASLEGNLSEKEMVEFKGFIGLNPDLKLEVKAFRSTFLVPDQNVTYIDKASLKKSPFWVTYRSTIYYAASIAASFLLLFGLYEFLYTPDKNVIVDGNLSAIKMQDYVDDKVPAALQKEIEFRTDIIYVNYDEKIFESESSKSVILIEPLRSRPVQYLNTIPENQQNIIAFREDVLKTQFNVDSENEVLMAANTEKEKSFLSSFIGNFTKKLMGRSNLKQDDKKSSFIEYTVQGYNLLTDKDVEVKREYDENGEVMAYNVIGDRIEFTTKKRKPGRE